MLRLAGWPIGEPVVELGHRAPPSGQGHTRDRPCHCPHLNADSPNSPIDVFGATSRRAKAVVHPVELVFTRLPILGTIRPAFSADRRVPLVDPDVAFHGGGVAGHNEPMNYGKEC